MFDITSSSIQLPSESRVPTRSFLVRAPGHNPVRYHHAIVRSTDLRDAAAQVIFKLHYCSIPDINEFSSYFCPECETKMFSILSSSNPKRARVKQQNLFQTIRDDLVVSARRDSLYQYHVRSCCFEVEVFDPVDVFLASTPSVSPSDRVSSETRLHAAFELSRIDSNILRDIIAGLDALPTPETLPLAFLLAVEIARPQLCNCS